MRCSRRRIDSWALRLLAKSVNVPCSPSAVTTATGRRIGWIAWVTGRPLFLGNHDRTGRMAVISLLDETEFAAPDFCCRRKTFKLGYDVPLTDLPGRGQPQ